MVLAFKNLFQCLADFRLGKIGQKAETAKVDPRDGYIRIPNNGNSRQHRAIATETQHKIYIFGKIFVRTKSRQIYRTWSCRLQEFIKLFMDTNLNTLAPKVCKQIFDKRIDRSVEKSAIYSYTCWFHSFRYSIPKQKCKEMVRYLNNSSKVRIYSVYRTGHFHLQRWPSRHNRFAKGRIPQVL